MGRHKGYKMSKAQKRAISKALKRRHEQIDTSGNHRSVFGIFASILRRN